MKTPFLSLLGWFVVLPRFGPFAPQERPVNGLCSRSNGKTLRQT